ncbi:MAG: PhzF family phenazine biosynthesis protein [Rhodoferax sp.]|nr:PhzF family phenazine biosynthesis protein [Rhodoferax sp.]
MNPDSSTSTHPAANPHPAPDRARAYAQVDVFTAEALRGNPVAVVLDSEGLDAGQMQRLACWTQLSETTFVLPPSPEARAAGADYRLRIFTPGGELPFAGHPTLGSCHAWLQAGGQPGRPGVVLQECGVGLVTLRIDGQRSAFAAPPLQRHDPEPALLQAVLQALGLDPQALLAAQQLDNGPRWLGLLLADPDRVARLEPDHARLKFLGQKVGVAAVEYGDDAPFLIARSNREARAFGGPGASRTGPGATPRGLLVRAFAAPLGVPEDPVTGSLNASLAQWLMAEGLLPERYIATQGAALGRHGQVYLERDAQGQVWVGGDCVCCISGTLRL